MVPRHANLVQYSIVVSLDSKSAVLSLNFWFPDTKVQGQYSTFAPLDCKSVVLSLNFKMRNPGMKDVSLISN